MTSLRTSLNFTSVGFALPPRIPYPRLLRKSFERFLACLIHGTVSTHGSNRYGCIPYLPTEFSSKSLEAEQDSGDKEALKERYFKVRS